MNLTRITESYINEHPSIKDTLKKGLINYSSLARKIIEDKDLPEDKFDAVLIACRRTYSKLKKDKGKENKILEILKKSKVELKNKIVVIVLEKDIHMPNLLEVEKKAVKASEVFHIVQSPSAITVATSEDFLGELKKVFKNKILTQETGLAEITLKSPKEIETTPGAVAYLYSLLGENNINVLETMSCWTDTIFIIKDKEIAKVMELFSF